MKRPTLPSPTGRRAVSVLSTLVVVALVVPFVVYSTPAVVGAEASYVVLSGSMEPTIGTGDVVFVYSTDPAAVTDGTVLTFRTEGRQIPTTHRVIEVVDTEVGPAFRTQGDANEDPDPSAVRPNQVVGVVPSVTLPVVGEVYAAVPWLGYAVELLNTNLGFAGLVVVPIALLVATEALSLARGLTRQSADDEDGPDGETTAADPTPAAAAGAEADADATPGEGADATYTLTARDLRLTVVVLAVFAVYTAVVAYLETAAWSVTAAVAVFSVLAMVGAIRCLGAGTVADDADTGMPSATDGGFEEGDGPAAATPGEETDATFTFDEESVTDEPAVTGSTAGATDDRQGGDDDER